MTKYAEVHDCLRLHGQLSMEKIIELTGLTKKEIAYNVRKNPNITRESNILIFKIKPVFFPASLKYTDCENMQSLFAIYILKTRDYSIDYVHWFKFCNEYGFAKVFKFSWKRIVYRNMKKDVLRKLEPYL